MDIQKTSLAAALLLAAQANAMTAKPDLRANGEETTNQPQVTIGGQDVLNFRPSCSFGPVPLPSCN